MYLNTYILMEISKLSSALITVKYFENGDGNPMNKAVVDS